MIIITSLHPLFVHTNHTNETKQIMIYGGNLSSSSNPHCSNNDYHIIIKCDSDKGSLKCWKEVKKRISCNFQRCPWQVPRIRGDSRGEAQFFNPSPTFLTQPDSCQLEVFVLIFCSFQPTSPRKIIGLQMKLHLLEGMLVMFHIVDIEEKSLQKTATVSMSIFKVQNSRNDHFQAKFLSNEHLIAHIIFSNSSLGLSIYYVIRDGGGSPKFITILHRAGS